MMIKVKRVRVERFLREGAKGMDTVFNRDIHQQEEKEKRKGAKPSTDIEQSSVRGLPMAGPVRNRI